jgi:hypothetical protein
MDELDEFWLHELERALANAKNTGRSDVADYIELKQRNDVLRETGVRWLNEAVAAVAFENGANAGRIEVVRDAPHRFAFRKATMAGTRLQLKQGVRCLTVEAGWTRTPSDGFMRGGALAAARITHLGMPKSGAELGLYAREGVPHWILFVDEKNAAEFTLDHVRIHFNTFVN